MSKNENIFTIGDKIVRNNFNENKIRIIESFWVKNNILYVKCNDGSNLLLSEIEHIKQPLFTTEDGVDIFENNKYLSSVHIPSFTLLEKSLWNTYISKEYFKSNKYFSTKEKAEEFILLNKPCLSLNDIFKDVEKMRKGLKTFENSELAKRFKKLVQQKLNK